ncbi:hypothetical protein [Ferruginibacter sp. SUN106]|uniref:hypothetical protein n=1 Tax=Ferruginibacter sp. SUN106 TaxID=2978348 RepID=UPI003D36D8FE
MNKPNQHLMTNPILQVVRNFIGKLRQNPDVYPIRYYKKGKQFRRKWQTPLVK